MLVNTLMLVNSRIQLAFGCQQVLKSSTLLLVEPFFVFCLFFIFFHFPFFYPVGDGKRFKKAEKDDFNQQTVNQECYQKG